MGRIETSSSGGVGIRNTSEVKTASVVLLIVAGAGSAAAAGMADGKTIAVQGGSQGATACVSCHGLDGAGNAQAGFPRLAGLDPAYLVRQIEAYRTGGRENPIMMPIAKSLTAAETDAVSAYYAGLPSPNAPAPPVEAALLKQGQQLAQVGNWDNNIPACVSCHGPDGSGAGSAFPALAGQHASYLKSQLQAWRNGTRSNDPNQLMKVVAERMSDREIQAAAAYFAAQPGQDSVEGSRR